MESALPQKVSIVESLELLSNMENLESVMAMSAVLVEQEIKFAAQRLGESFARFDGQKISRGFGMKAEDWIDVVDRLPSNSRMVLVYTSKDKVHLAQFYKHEWLLRGFGKVAGVTHWMEIVKPNNI